MPAPPWLQDEPEVLALLNAALDRFDQQSAVERQRPTSIAIEKYLPTLARQNAQADQLWAFMRDLAALQVLTLRTARRGAYDAEWRGAKVAFNERSEAILREWLNRPASVAPLAEWRAAVQAHAALFPNGVDALLERRIVIVGKRSDEVVRALASLGTIRVAATLRQLSAHAFWGDSKMLDDRGDLLAVLFPKLAIRERPIVVAVHLPNAMQGVLFVENQDTYTAAIEGEPREASDLALVYLSGFKNTAARIRERSGASLHFSGALQRTEALTTWWFGDASPALPVYFWGDLDFAGMNMLKLLRQRFSGVQAWQPGYAPMLAALLSCGGKGTQGLQQVDPIETGCAYADLHLLPAIRQHGFYDQERIADSSPQELG